MPRCGSAAKALFPLHLRGVTDPMSGFFLVRPGAIDLDALRPRGFKILLELLVRCPTLRRAEVGFTFAERHAEESKGSLREGLNYLRSLCELRFRLGTVASGPAAAAPAAAPLVPLPQDSGAG